MQCNGHERWEHCFDELKEILSKCKKKVTTINKQQRDKSRYSAHSPKSIYLSSIQTNSNCFGVIAKFRLQNMVKKKAADVSVYPFLKN